MHRDDLIYDWHHHANGMPTFNKEIELCDETLRDGIQSPSVVDPPIEAKLELISLMNALRITIADIGLPGAGPRAYDDVLRIARFVRDQRYGLRVNCAARTVEADIAPIADIQQRVGIPMTAYCFLGTSPIRQLVENWDLDMLKKTIANAIGFAKRAGLAVAFVTEDTIRSNPPTLSSLFKQAIDMGVERLVLCDTVGCATPDAIKALVCFTKEIIRETGEDVKIDWHGHNDRGLGVANAIFAAEYGCDRIHGTALGVGERVGNTSIDQLMVNLKLLGGYPHDLTPLSKYIELASQCLDAPLPYNYPVFGRDAFRTATGVHAAAVIKALQRDDELMANAIYSGVPAHWFGKSQAIEIGPMSGASNVRYWLKQNQLEPHDDLTKGLLDFAKSQSKVLSDKEIREFVNGFNAAG